MPAPNRIFILCSEIKKILDVCEFGFLGKIQLVAAQIK
jgi:hypothetical protein